MKCERWGKLKISLSLIYHKSIWSSEESYFPRCYLLCQSVDFRCYFLLVPLTNISFSCSCMRDGENQQDWVSSEFSYNVRYIRQAWVSWEYRVRKVWESFIAQLILLSTAKIDRTRLGRRRWTIFESRNGICTRNTKTIIEMSQMSQKASSSSLHENNYYSAFLHQLRVNVNEIEEWEGRKFHILPFPQLYSESRFVFSCCRSWELRQGEEFVVLLRLRLRRRIENVPVILIVLFLSEIYFWELKCVDEFWNLSNVLQA